MSETTKNRIKRMVDLFLSFARIGLFTFGGGYAMIPLIARICVEKKGWITDDDMMEITAIAGSTPGSVAVNSATYVGSRICGVPGAAAATIGVVLPSFVIICLISAVLDRFLEITVIAHALKGIKLAVGILILDAALRMFRQMEKKPLACGILAGAALGLLMIDLFALHFSTIGIMLIGGAVGLSVFAVQEIVRKKRGGGV